MKIPVSLRIGFIAASVLLTSLPNVYAQKAKDKPKDKKEEKEKKEWQYFQKFVGQGWMKGKTSFLLGFNQNILLPKYQGK